jgi:hypothetical protein
MMMTADEVPSGPSRARSLALGILARCAVLALVFVALGVPVTDLWRFLLVTIAVMALSFGSVRSERGRWLIALAAVLAVLAVKLVLPGPRIEEGDNVYIPVGTSLDVYEAELPADAERQMREIFDDSYIDNPKGLPGSPDWWQEEEFKRKPSPFADHAFAPSSDALWQRPKYSRTVDAVDFDSQEDARIGAINRRAYNFFQPSTKKGKQAALGFANSARIDRNTMPFFVMVEFNAALAGGEICWRGQALVEGDGGKFSLVDHADRTCRPIAEQDNGKRVFALAIARDKKLSFSVYPPFEQKLSVWARQIAGVLGALIILIALVRIDGVRQALLPLGAVLSTLAITLIMAPELLTGFPTHMGGNDGLVHESFGFDISQALRDGRYADALRGGEKIFYFMPGLRYLKALEDLLFGDTNFGVLLCTMFVPIFLYFLLRRLFPLRWSVCLIVIFLFTPLFERLGFAQYLYVKEMIKGFPEPLGYGVFLGALALVAWSVPMPDRAPARSPTPAMLIGLTLALSVALRPNVAIAAALILVMLGLWLLRERRFTEIAMLGLGFCPIFLITWHNWHFGGQFVPLTSAAFVPATLMTPPSTYLAALGELLRLDFSGDALHHVLRQLWNWNHVADVYRLIPLFTVVWVACSPRYDVPIRGLAVVALSLQAALFFYVPSGRYAYLAWLLVFLVFLVAFRESFLPWVTRTYPESIQRLGSLAVVRGVREAVASSRWA